MRDARTGTRTRTRSRPILIILLMSLLGLSLAAALAGACGGSSGGTAADSPAATSAPSPAPGADAAPLPGTVSDAAAEFWRLMDAGDHTALNAAMSPNASATALVAENDDIARARLVRVDDVSSIAGSAPVEKLVQMTVLIKPVAAGQSPTPWGATGEHTLFLQLEKAEPAGWYWTSWGTSP